MKTSFVHSVDAASLALIIPILASGLKSRTPQTKKMSAQVVGSICSLIADVKDILPYAPVLTKSLKGTFLFVYLLLLNFFSLLLAILFDPIPEVRTVAARAVASLYRYLGDLPSELLSSDSTDPGSSMHEIVPWLVSVLRGESTPVTRSGAAQGLAQVLAVTGAEKAAPLLLEFYDDVKPNRSVAVREGFYSKKKLYFFLSFVT
jgi:hypothetical protein